MAFSIWEYIRERTRDSVLAGIQDAMDHVEQGDTNGSQHARASELAARLNPPKGLPAEGMAAESQAEQGLQEAVQKAPGAAANGAVGESATAAKPSARRAAQPAKKSAPPSRPKSDAFDDEFEGRLAAAATPENGQQQTPPAGSDGSRMTDRKKRGRPRKDGAR